MITVPVTEEGSGADEITYTVTPDGEAAREETAPVQNGRAEITVSADFKGTISIVCADNANNTSASVTVGAGLDANGIIIENHAPEIAFQAENAELLPSGEYQAAPDIAVTVADDKNNAVSGGIASVSYQINGGSGETVPHDYTASMVVHDSFTIPASEIPDGETVISVTATDHAGNSITETYTVKVLSKVTGGDNGSSGGDSGSSGSGSSGSSGSGDSGGSSSGSGESANQPQKEAGTVSKDVEKNENAPDTKLSGSEKDLADIILTEEEKAKVENGTDIRVILDIKDAQNIADSDEKAAVEKTLSENTSVQGYDVGQYLDISLYKVIGTERSAILETSKKLTVVIAVPDSLKSKDSGKPRTFAVIRVHDGAAEVLKDLDDDADTITIETDRFSAYVIVYKEGATAVKPDTDPAKSQLHSGLKAVPEGNMLQISWGSVSGADGYDVYVQYCGKKFDAESRSVVKGGKKTTFTINKVNGKAVDTKKKIKIYVVAWQQKNGKKTTLAKSLIMHIAGKDDAAYTNVKRIQVKKSSYTLEKGKDVTLAPTAVLYDKKKKQLSNNHAKEFRYLSSNQNVATVTAGGKVKAKGIGSCTIYIIARNGCSKKIQITVTE